MSTPILRLATRGSPLALAQAHLVRASLADAHGWDEGELDEICPIMTFRTTGDRIQDRPLVEAGGKGLFVKEIEEALLGGEADIAVHSVKDMPARQPAGLSLSAVLPREDPHDLFIAKDGAPFDKLDENSRLGTSSVRRQAQALRLRPDLKIVSLRGNVETRLLKLARGEADAIMLARAGVARLKLALPDSEILDSPEWLPALCQGAIGIEIRSEDNAAYRLVEAIDDWQTHLAIACERGFLAALDGSCRTPIAGLAETEESHLYFRGEVLTVDGRNSWTASRKIHCEDPASEHSRARAFAAGEDAAKEIRDRAGSKLPRF
jgi:hydroxymethylbilane synthase